MLRTADLLVSKLTFVVGLVGRNKGPAAATPSNSLPTCSPASKWTPFGSSRPSLSILTSGDQSNSFLSLKRSSYSASSIALSLLPPAVPIPVQRSC